jgi:prepilin-type N-terminal cleavage/methylation domain-containing protein
MCNSFAIVRFFGGSRGFSAIELMVVLLLVAIFTALALPSFEGTLKRYRVDTVASEIADVLQFARAEAIRTGSTVTVAPTSAATPGCTVATYTDWHCGIDVLSPDQTAIKTIPATDFNGINVALASATPGQLIYNYIAYDPLGFMKDNIQENINVWPSSEASPATASYVNVVCPGASGKINIITSYDLSDC